VIAGNLQAKYRPTGATTAVGVPVWQHIRLSHPDNHAHFIASLGKTF